ncbi:M48 family metallopeptidase [Chromobacterium phragmitis]|uniref:metal-dependent hydrolase n=1 Tax=Chromobacterium amazonense TaxID=1382803 RepID=UPI0021B84329|nr:metal-dependent hydrolase [Chromobacterium amazonense]MBM2885708.1 M48 family metallopeptidase [Chromobacterium amazonense]
MTTLSYLRGYPAALLERIQTLLEQDQLGAWLERKYPARHDIQTDKALYQYVTELKQSYLKNAPAVAKVLYDSQQHPMKGTLGTNTFVARVQGGKLKSKNEIRIAALFRDAPEAFLRMIVIHELVRTSNLANGKICKLVKNGHH